MPIENATEHPFNQLARQANKWMDQMQKGFYVYSGETWTPNVNLYETASSYFVCVDLAGVDKQKIDVEVVDQRLKLRGTRAVPSYDDAAPGEPVTNSPGHTAGNPAPSGQTPGASHASKASHAPQAHGAPPGNAQGAAEADAGSRRTRIHLMEIDHGAFSREVELPLDVNKNMITANYRNGLLWVEIPKS
jgi:HSP20 family molecular chaperone IbpA